MADIDVWQLASEIEKVSDPETRKEIEEFVSTINGKSMTPGEIVQNVVGPVIGITNTANKKFTIDLVQAVVDELQKNK